jgi:hypothetical protein
MIFMAQSISSCKIARARNNFLDKRNDRLYSGRTPSNRAGWQVLVTLANPYTADSYPVKNEESTMPDHSITGTRNKGETPYAIVKLTPNDLEGKDWVYLQEWASNLNVSVGVLLHRILVAAIIGQLYVEKIPKI